MELHNTEEHISGRALRQSAANLIPAGIPIVCTRMAVGRAVAATTDVAINQDLKALFPARDVDARYLLQALNELRPQLEAVATGSTVKGIRIEQLLEFQIRKPSLDEQRYIADVLDAIDSAIRVARVSLDKLRLLHSGLISALIDQQEPNARLGDVLQSRPTNGIYKPENQIGRGTLLIGQTAFTADRRVDPQLARRAVVSTGEQRRFGLMEEDILVSRVYATLGGVGQPAIVGAIEEPAVFESNMMRVRSDTSRANPMFLFESLSSFRARSHVVAHANLSNQASISQEVLVGMPMWIPSRDEQDGIARVVAGVWARVDREKHLLRKLRLLRRGLASEILSERAPYRQVGVV